VQHAAQFSFCDEFRPFLRCADFDKISAVTILLEMICYKFAYKFKLSKSAHLEVGETAFGSAHLILAFENPFQATSLLAQKDDRRSCATVTLARSENRLFAGHSRIAKIDI
jgi:hypothetical protein